MKENIQLPLKLHKHSINKISVYTMENLHLQNQTRAESKHQNLANMQARKLTKFVANVILDEQPLNIWKFNILTKETQSS